jgi:hypothetical protein
MSSQADNGMNGSMLNAEELEEADEGLMNDMRLEEDEADEEEHEEGEEKNAEEEGKDVSGGRKDASGGRKRRWWRSVLQDNAGLVPYKPASPTHGLGAKENLEEAHGVVAGDYLEEGGKLRWVLGKDGEWDEVSPWIHGTGCGVTYGRTSDLYKNEWTAYPEAPSRVEIAYMERRELDANVLEITCLNCFDGMSCSEFCEYRTDNESWGLMDRIFQGAESITAVCLMELFVCKPCWVAIWEKFLSLRRLMAIRIKSHHQLPLHPTLFYIRKFAENYNGPYKPILEVDICMTIDAALALIDECNLSVESHFLPGYKPVPGGSTHIPALHPGRSRRVKQPLQTEDGFQVWLIEVQSMERVWYLTERRYAQHQASIIEVGSDSE